MPEEGIRIYGIMNSHKVPVQVADNDACSTIDEMQKTMASLMKRLEQVEQLVVALKEALKEEKEKSPIEVEIIEKKEA